MDTQLLFSKNPGRRFTLLLLLLLLIAILAAACSSTGSSDNGNDTKSSNVEMEEYNESIVDYMVILPIRFAIVDTDGDSLFGLMTGLDMQPGTIRVYGTYEKTDGTVEPGTADIAFSLNDGKLVTTITGADMEGFSPDQPRILKFNEALAREFTTTISENDIVEISKFEIGTESIEITYKTTVE